MCKQTTDVKLCYNMKTVNFFIYYFYNPLTCREVLLRKSNDFNYQKTCLIATVFSNLYFCLTPTSVDSHNKDFKGKQVNMAAINKYKNKGKEQSFCLQVLLLPTDEQKRVWTGYSEAIVRDISHCF